METSNLTRFSPCIMFGKPSMRTDKKGEYVCLKDLEEELEAYQKTDFELEIAALKHEICLLTGMNRTLAKRIVELSELEKYSLERELILEENEKQKAYIKTILEEIHNGTHLESQEKGI